MAGPSCTCCRRPWTLVDDDLLDQGGESVCRACRAHLGSSVQSGAEHLAMWTDVYRRTCEDATSVERQLRAALAALMARLEQEMRRRPERVVEKWLGEEELDAAKAEAERAFRSREVAWQGLCELRLLHHDQGDGRCGCGKVLAGCREAAILARHPGVETWERQQVARLRQGLQHALPERHPVLQDPRLLDSWDDVAFREDGVA